MTPAPEARKHNAWRLARAEAKAKWSLTRGYLIVLCRTMTLVLAAPVFREWNAAGFWSGMLMFGLYMGLVWVAWGHNRNF